MVELRTGVSIEEYLLQQFGRSGEIQHLADHMLSMRDAKYGKLVVTSSGKDLK